MMHLEPRWISLGTCATLCMTLALMVGGCGKEEAPPVVINDAPPPPPPAPPRPSITPIEQLMSDLNIDRRIVLPEEQAPDSDDERKAVLVFFDAFARGNAQALRGMMPLADQLELNALVESGAWQETVAKIARIDVQTGTSSLGQDCALAIIEVGEGGTSNFQPQLWYYVAHGDEVIFEAAPTPPGIIDRLSGGDWIAAWHKILEQELAKAQEPDEDISIAQKNLDEGDERSSSGPTRSAGGSGPQRSPGGPGPATTEP